MKKQLLPAIVAGLFLSTGAMAYDPFDIELIAGGQYEDVTITEFNDAKTANLDIELIAGGQYEDVTITEFNDESTSNLDSLFILGDTAKAGWYDDELQDTVVTVAQAHPVVHQVTPATVERVRREIEVPAVTTPFGESG